MAISVDWPSKVITVPQADLTPISGSLYELNTNTFRLALKALEDDTAGMPWERTHRHNGEVTIAGLTFARTIEIINGYTVTFENGSYAVRLVGSNNNIADEGIINRNSVSVILGNSAGLIGLDEVQLIKKIIDPKKHEIDVVAQKRRVYEEDGTTVLREWDISDKDGNNVTLGAGDPAVEER